MLFSSVTVYESETHILKKYMINMMFCFWSDITYKRLEYEN